MHTLQLNLSRTVSWFRSDGRHFQIVSQILFLIYGIFYLGWDADWMRFGCAILGCMLTQGLAVRYAGLPAQSMKSAMITVLGLCLLFKANEPVLFLLAGIFAISQKFLIRINGKHLWNPANFGIITMILLTGDAWVSPGQWGSSVVLVFVIGSLGLGVLSKVKRIDTGLLFVAVIAILDYLRTVLYLGWGHDVWIHKLSGGALWLFALFMITDPMTTPNNRTARIIWVIIVAGISFYLSAFKFISAAPIWVLFFATPIVPLIDMIFSGAKFQWLSGRPSLLSSK